MKSGFVSIVGRPNVGKSTIINSIIGEKISIVTNKPQTTRNNIRGIYNGDDVQIVFLDTPGIHKPFKKLGVEMNSMAYSSAHDADVLVIVIDASLPFGKGDEYIVSHLGFDAKLILCFNKIDQTKIQDIEKLKAKYKEIYPTAVTIETVATEKVNVDLLLNTIISMLDEGPAYYPRDEVTDKDSYFRISEIIREKTLLLLNDEVPHSIAISVSNINENGKDLEIYASIITEKDSQKGIIIGKGGAMIKKIGMVARKELEYIYKRHIYLDLRVKVKEDWRDDPKILSSLGYDYKK